MAAITKIEFWRDTGFIDGGVEIPALSAADLTNPDIEYEPDDPIIPSRDRFFSEFKLKDYFANLLDVSYMRVTYDFSDGTLNPVTKTFYGWVTDVSYGSDANLPMTIVSWHIDEWRTWKSAVTFGSGHIKRRPFIDIASTPIQNYQWRYLEMGTNPLTTPSDLIEQYIRYSGTPPAAERALWWIIVSLNMTDSNGITTIRYAAIPLWIPLTLYNDEAINYTDTEVVLFKDGYGNTAQGLSLMDIMRGKLDEYLGAAPSTINGVWLSPLLFPVADISGTGELGDGGAHALTVANSSLVKPVPGKVYGYYVINDYRTPVKTPVSFSLGQSILSTETEQFIITGFDGSKVLDLPYGMLLDSCDVYLIIEADTAAIAISFKDGFEGRTEGCVATIPLPTLPINSNALSEYVYSGQRDYDRDARTVASNASAWKNSAGGAGQGAMMGAFGPAGLAVGVAGGISGGLINYGVEMLYQNDEEQALTDRLMARQPSSLLLGSQALTAVIMSHPPKLRMLQPDAYSLQQISDMRDQFGISVDELTTSCDVLIRTTAATGYYNIQNLIVTGDIPVSAKRWIREKFRSGVRLI